MTIEKIRNLRDWYFSSNNGSREVNNCAQASFRTTVPRVITRNYAMVYASFRLDENKSRKRFQTLTREILPTFSPRTHRDRWTDKFLRARIVREYPMKIEFSRETSDISMDCGSSRKLSYHVWSYYILIIFYILIWVEIFKRKKFLNSFNKIEFRFLWILWKEKIKLIRKTSWIYILKEIFKKSVIIIWYYCLKYLFN